MNLNTAYARMGYSGNHVRGHAAMRPALSIGPFSDAPDSEDMI